MAPSKEWKEKIEPGEAEQLELYATQLAAIQTKRGNARGISRGLHAKGNLGAVAEFEVLPDLPEHARVGLFGTPAKYKAYVRYSNGTGARQSDRKPDVRGIAVKLMGVPGKKIIPGLEDATTQDFLLIRSPTTPFRNADEFVPFVLALSTPATALPKLLFKFGPFKLLKVLKTAGPSMNAPVMPLAATRYFSAVPIQLGEYAIRYGLLPRDTYEGVPVPGESKHYLAEALAERLRKGPVVYDFQAQFFVDEARTPIEDASVDWLESDSPYVTLGRLTLAQQDVDEARGKKLGEHIEQLSFDPWHAQRELKPLGHMMRARNAAYRVSTKTRGALPEPDGSEKFD